MEQNLATTSPNIAGIYGWLVWASPTCGNAFPALAFFLVGSAPLPTLSCSLNFSFPFGWGTNSNAMKGNKDKRSSGGISHFLFPTYFFRWLVWFLVFDFCNATCTAARIRQKLHALSISMLRMVEWWSLIRVLLSLHGLLSFLCLSTKLFEPCQFGK